MIRALIGAPPLRGSDDAVFATVNCVQVVIWLALTAWLLTPLANSTRQAAVAAVLGWLAALSVAFLVVTVTVLAVWSDDRCFS